MKTLRDYEKELSKCSKCGLCESVCPLYKLVPNECVASKGKFIMLRGVAKGDLELSKNINRYIDLCLKCGKCKEFCPADIDICQILNVAKTDYVKNKWYYRLVKFFQEKFMFGLFVRFMRFVSSPYRPKHSKNGKISVVYFKGCVNQIFPNTDGYIHKIFKDEITINEPDFECCGLPFLSEGNLEAFEQVANKNLEELSDGADCIVTDCASCESTLKSYPQYVKADSKFENKTFVNWGDIIAEQNLKFKSKKPVRVTFHKPCHLHSDSFFERIMSRCVNIDYVKMKEYDSCCGFAGSFALKNPKLSYEISQKKAENIKATGADYVITTCPLCIVGIKRALLMSGAKTKVISLLEFLATKCTQIVD